MNADADQDTLEMEYLATVREIEKKYKNYVAVASTPPPLSVQTVVLLEYLFYSGPHNLWGALPQICSCSGS